MLSDIRLALNDTGFAAGLPGARDRAVLVQQELARFAGDKVVSTKRAIEVGGRAGRVVVKDAGAGSRTTRNSHCRRGCSAASRSGTCQVVCRVCVNSTSAGAA